MRTGKNAGDGSVYLRGKVWWMSFCLDGIEYQESTKMRDREAAEKVLADRIKEKNSAELGHSALLTGEMKRTTINELLRALEEDFEARGILTDSNACQIKIAKKKFGPVRAVKFGAKQVNAFHKEQLAERYANASINRILEMVKRAFELAVTEERFPRTRVPYIKRLSEKSNTRMGFVTRDEFNRVHANLPADLQDFALFGFLCGWRKGEISSMTWDNIQDGKIVMDADQTKNRTAHSLPIFGEVAEIIERREKFRAKKLENGTTTFSKSDSPVFTREDGTRVGDFRKVWSKAVTAAGKPNLIFHDLRRSAVSALVNAGVPPLVAMTISGHKTISVFKRYAIPMDDSQAEALAAVENYHKTKVAEAEAKRKGSNVVPMASRT